MDWPFRSVVAARTIHHADGPEELSHFITEPEDNHSS